MIKKERYKPKIIVICGQTGSGKTDLAVSFCKKFRGEIVNADSRQVYREMDIGTAKGLDKDFKFEILNFKFNTIRGIPVHLVNIVEPNEKYNVGRFKKEAEGVIEDIVSRGKVPFVVGGTGLYIDALVDNYEIPEIRIWNDRRQSVTGNITDYHPSLQNPKSKSLHELIKDLKKLDLQALNIVDLKNRRRIERALEYCLNTGKKFSESRKKGERKYEILKIAPKIDREELHKKIDQRVEEMIEEGLVEEVKMLAEKYGWESEAMTGIGYREWKEYFKNDKFQISNVKKNSNIKSQISKNTGVLVGTRFIASVQQVADQIKQSTRQYAKRQMTWFKRDKEINWIGSTKEAEKLIEDFLK